MWKKVVLTLLEVLWQAKSGIQSDILAVTYVTLLLPPPFHFFFSQSIEKHAGLVFLVVDFSGFFLGVWSSDLKIYLNCDWLDD